MPFFCFFNRVVEAKCSISTKKTFSWTSDRSHNKVLLRSCVEGVKVRPAGCDVKLLKCRQCQQNDESATVWRISEVRMQLLVCCQNHDQTGILDVLKIFSSCWCAADKWGTSYSYATDNLCAISHTLHKLSICYSKEDVLKTSRAILMSLTLSFCSKLI